MDESKILSSEEVEALLKVSQDKDYDLSKLLDHVINPDDAQDSINIKAISNITEMVWSECEKIFSSFIRKKVHVRHHESKVGILSQCLVNKTEKHIFTVFHVLPNNYFCLVVIDMPFLHHTINALYGGVVNAKEPIMETPGNVGLIIAEKLNELIMESFSMASKEYGKITYNTFKTITLPNLISKIGLEDEVYSLQYTVYINEAEANVTLMIPTEFFQKFIPAKIDNDNEHLRINQSWRTAIQNQVIDSDVTLIASLPNVTIKAKELMTLKSGDLIPIGDPTQVDICLNEVKLFQGAAAQTDSKRIVKILSEN